MKNYITLLLTLALLSNLNAQTTSSGTGAWGAGPTWGTGVVPPDNGDSIFINDPDAVIVAANQNYTVPIVIVVRGNLVLDKDLILASGSRVIVEVGGSITSGNNGNRLYIGALRWKDFKDDPSSGPDLFTDIVLSAVEMEFNAERASNSNDVIIEWNVSSIQNIKKLVVQKSTDGKTFVDYEEITLSTKGQYVVDEIASNRLTLVRLKVVSTSGDHFSKPIQIVNENLKISVYPNPFLDFVKINIPYDDDNIEVKLLDMLGNKVVNNINLNEKINTNDLNPGVYLITISNDSQVIYSDRLVKK